MSQYFQCLCRNPKYRKQTWSTSVIHRVSRFHESTNDIIGFVTTDQPKTQKLLFVNTLWRQVWNEPKSRTQWLTPTKTLGHLSSYHSTCLVLEITTFLKYWWKFKFSIFRLFNINSEEKNFLKHVHNNLLYIHSYFSFICLFMVFISEFKSLPLYSQKSVFWINFCKLMHKIVLLLVAFFSTQIKLQMYSKQKLIFVAQITIKPRFLFYIGIIKQHR